MEDQCPSLDAPAEFNDFSVQGMCEQGSITFVLAVAGLALVLASSYILEKKTKNAFRDDEATKELEAKAQKKEGEELEAQKHKEENENFLKTTEKEDGWVLNTINEYLVLPFIPHDLQGFVLVTFILWFALTIPMATTRLYEKMWRHELLFQQGPLNVLANMLGCKGLNFLAIPYSKEVDDTSPFDKIEPLPDKDSPAELDPYFTFHLMCGILWLTVGFIQMYWAQEGWSLNKKVNSKVHGIFGRFFVTPSFCLHIVFASRMVYRNPVNQNKIIIFMYWCTIVDCIIGFVDGVMAIRSAKSEETELNKKEFKRGRHVLKMGSVYIQSIFGSGPIRVTAWILWIVAKFFPRRFALRIDRVVCQRNASCLEQKLGSAEDCFIPVYLNLSLTQIFQLWIEFLFISCASSDSATRGESLFKLSEKEKKAFKTRVTTMVIFSAIVFPMLLFESLDKITLPIQLVSAVYARSRNIWRLLEEFHSKIDPDDDTKKD